MEHILDPTVLCGPHRKDSLLLGSYELPGRNMNTNVTNK